MRVFYRLSESSNIRIRVPGTTKQSCLENFFKNFKLTPYDSMFLLADSVSDTTYANILEWVKGYPVEVARSQSGSEAGSFRLLLNKFEGENLPSNEYVYFAEDDYIYVSDARRILNEGLMIGDYATLRLHPDKFIPPSKGGNPLLDEKGGESTRIYLGVDNFWMLTNSTGMYPATSVKTMCDDLDIWYWGVQERASKDFDIWLKLRAKGRTLVMPIPTGMSHSEIESESSLIGTGYCCWENALHGDCKHR
jgi:hypothetical protein